MSELTGRLREIIFEHPPTTRRMMFGVCALSFVVLLWLPVGAAVVVGVLWVNALMLGLELGRAREHARAGEMGLFGTTQMSSAPKLPVEDDSHRQLRGALASSEAARDRLLERSALLKELAGVTDDEEMLRKIKGDRFERFLLSLFNLKVNRLISWRGDKFLRDVTGGFPESNRWPDLELECTYNGRADRFAIECKWRTAWNTTNHLQWCDTHKLDEYNAFARDHDMPVFVALGVGGRPDAPAELFVIPLHTLHNEHLTREAASAWAMSPHARLIFLADRGVIIEQRTSV